MALITTTVDVGPGVTSTGDTVITPGELVASGGTISNTVATDGGVTIAFNGGVEIGQSWPTAPYRKSPLMAQRLVLSLAPVAKSFCLRMTP